MLKTLMSIFLMIYIRTTKTKVNRVNEFRLHLFQWNFSVIYIKKRGWKQKAQTKAGALWAFVDVLVVDWLGYILTLGVFVCPIHRQFPVLYHSCKDKRERNFNAMNSCFVSSGIRLIIMYLSRYGRGCRWSTIVLNKWGKKKVYRFINATTLYSIYATQPTRMYITT